MNRRNQLLVIDDDPAVGQLIASVLGTRNFQVISAYSAAEGLARLERQAVDLVLLDNILPDVAGLDALHRLRQLYPQLPILFVTTSGTASTAIEAMKSGAVDCLRKPLDLLQLRTVIESHCGVSAAAELSLLNLDSAAAFDNLPLIGECSAMQEVFKAIGRFANHDEPVLIAGEIGTGKETVARTIHQHSRRCSEPFVAIHLPAYSSTQLAQEVFGTHDAGDLAILDKVAGGTLFLQEIGDLTLHDQSKLWRWLAPFAHPTAASSDFPEVPLRLIATTSADLFALVGQGKFRADLYYLLTSHALRLPPLRERRQDLPALIGHVVSALARRLAPAVSVTVAEEVIPLLLAHSWPGNLDELIQVLKRALTEGNGQIRRTPALWSMVQGATLSRVGDGVGNERSPVDAEVLTNWSTFLAERIDRDDLSLYDEAVSDMESKLLPLVMQQTQGNQARAARLLGMTRASLRKKLRSLQAFVDASLTGR